MLELIPAPLHRQLYRVADRVRRAWWLVRRPRRSSVFVVAFDEHDRVLLARHSYGPPVWALPGGGVGRREAPEAAARREFREELQCPLADLRLVTTETQPDSGSRDERHLFVARLAGTPVPDLREIVEIGWFDPHALPANAGRWAAAGVREALAWRSQQA
jgi:8-oxo-dGTP pyrophosphatase MutT (NUDIX family)